MRDIEAVEKSACFNYSARQILLRIFAEAFRLVLERKVQFERALRALMDLRKLDSCRRQTHPPKY